MKPGAPFNSKDQTAETVFLVAAAMRDVADRLELLGKDLNTMPQPLWLPEGVKQASIESLATQGFGEDLAHSIFNAVIERTDIPREAILGPSRQRAVVSVRQVVMYLIYLYTDLSSPQVGLMMDRDHTMVFYSTTKVKQQLANMDSDVSKLVREVVKLLGLSPMSKKPERKKALKPKGSSRTAPKPAPRAPIPQGSTPHFVQPHR